jgi:serine phosphatase RsbU (regulator of sigma subunit)/Tfp pilus assembly protein PilF
MWKKLIGLACSRILSAFVLLTIFSSCLFSQSTERRQSDSLSNIIKQSANALAKAKAYVALSEIIYGSNIDTLIPLSKNAINLIDSAFKLSGDTGNKEMLNVKAEALNNLGYVLFYKGNTPKALNYYMQALAIRQQTADIAGLAESYNNVGALNKSIGNTDAGIDYYRKSLDLYIKEKDLKGQANILSNLGVLYDYKGNQDTALKYYMKALELAMRDSIKNKSEIARVLDNIVIIYDKEGKSAEALKYNLRSIDLFTELDDKEGLANALFTMGQIELNIDDLAKAREYGDKALKLSTKLGFPTAIMKSANLMYEIDSHENKWKDALDMHLLFTAMQDSVHIEETRKDIIQKEFQYDYDKKEAVLKAEQEKKNAIAAAESKRQKLAILFVIIVALAIGIIAIIIFRSLKTTRKKNEIIAAQKAEVEEKNKDILDSITYAKRLQDAILPPLNSIKQCLPQSFVLYKPKDIVAGDFYWMQQVGNTILIAAADCTGHGVPGAMVSVVCSNALNRTVKEFQIYEPGKILDKVRELVLETFEKSESNVQDGMDISLCSINTQTKEVQWSGAYNPLWYVKNNEILEMAPDKQPIGKSDNPAPFSTQTLTLVKGDILYLFTDGYADQFGGPKGKKFKYKALSDKLKVISNKSMEEQKSVLEQTLADWKGSLEQVDDILIIGISV